MDCSWFRCNRQDDENEVLSHFIAKNIFCQTTLWFLPVTESRGTVESPRRERFKEEISAFLMKSRNDRSAGKVASLSSDTKASSSSIAEEYASRR